MAEEANSTEVTLPQVDIQVQAPVDAPESKGVIDTRESLFGEHVPTEAELRGETSVPETPPGEDGREGQETSAPSSDTPETPVETPPTPPPGHVPIAALHEERGKRQAQSQRIQALEAEIAALKTPKTETVPGAADPSPMPKDFKVLSSEEFQTLAEDDVVASQVYLYNLQLHQKAEAARTASQEARKQAEAQLTHVVSERYAQIADAVPGYFDAEGGIKKGLVEFAVENGMDAEYLELLMSPETTILMPNGNKVLMGRGSVGLATMISNLLKKAASATPANAAQREAQLKAEGARQIIAQLKNDTNAGYRSLGEAIPGGQTSIPLDFSKGVTEADFARLSPADQERALRGV